MYLKFFEIFSKFYKNAVEFFVILTFLGGKIERFFKSFTWVRKTSGSSIQLYKKIGPILNGY